MKREIGFMTFTLFKKIIDEIARYPVLLVRIVGLGEPSLHPELKPMMDYALKKKVRIDFTSNGTLLQKVNHDEILRWNLEILGISIDGIDEASYSKIRVNGNYAEIKRNVAEFYKHRDRLDYKLPLIKIRNVLFPEYRPEELAAYKNEWQRISDLVTFNTLNPNKNFKKFSHLKKCSIVFFSATIRWDGKVPLCPYQFSYAEDEWIGDLNSQSLKEIWHTRRLKEVRKQFAKHEYQGIEFCKFCFTIHGSDISQSNKLLYNSFNSKMGKLLGKKVQLH